MKIAGLIMAVLGWLLAVSCVEVSSVGLQFAMTIIGILITAVGVIGVLNGAHLKNAIWKA
jgi:hypothetical protein